MKIQNIIRRLFNIPNKKAEEIAEAVFGGKVCPYCGRETELIDSSEIYHGMSYGWLYICRPCNAYVGCYKGTKRALGRLANAELRQLKHDAHEAFDQLWKQGFMSRPQSYSWLSQQMGTDTEHTHIGMYDEKQCKKVIEISSKYLEKIRKTKYNS